jgi:hypothetical protein
MQATLPLLAQEKSHKCYVEFQSRAAFLAFYIKGV